MSILGGILFVPQASADGPDLSTAQETRIAQIDLSVTNKVKIPVDDFLFSYLVSKNSERAFLSNAAWSLLALFLRFFWL